MATLLLIACTSASQSSVSSPTARVDADATLGCDTANITSDRPRPKRGKRDVVIGPVHLVSIRRFGRYPKRHFRADEGGDYSGKVPLVLGSETRLRLAVARRSRSHASLTYASRIRGKPRVRKGDSVLDFEACDAVQSVWPGAILVDGPQCVPLHLYIDDAERPEKLRVAFGRGTCKSKQN